MFLFYVFLICNYTKYFWECNKMQIKHNKNKLTPQDSIGRATGFFLFRNLVNNYNLDKEKQEDERKSIKKYGCTSLILSFISILLGVCSLVCKFSNLELAGFSNLLIVIIYILSGIVVSTILSLYAFVFAVLQTRLNRKSIGIIALIFSILAIGLVFSLILFLLI